jgi:glyoxylase-like metal-dependent hydrolase (beta-lactamase superfamily II)
MRAVLKSASVAALLAALAACATPDPEPNPELQAQPAAAPRPSGINSSMSNADPTQNVEVRQIAPGLRYVFGANVSSNTYVLDTPEGAVVVDTSRPPASRAHVEAFRAAGVTSAAYVILTHGHGDHTGGVPLWRATGAKVIAHETYPEFLAYQRLLGPFFQLRNGAQFQFAGGAGAAAPTNQTAYAMNAAQANLEPDIVFADEMTLAAGGLNLKLMHTPGETPDHISVWVPHLKAVFVGDNFYESFPNMYTLRGTRPRWPTDYISSIDKVLALEPEMVLPSHGPPVIGKDEVKRQLGRYRDAIVYVHDAVVAGMNAGKDVHTLMQEIKLPPDLDVGEGYGKISWSVRGIYEGYAGWFNGDPSTMFESGRDSVSANIVALAGPEKLASEAMALLEQGKAVEALHLATIGIEGAPDNPAILRARAAALQALLAASGNRNEQGWLQQGLAQTRARLGE